MSVKRSLRSCVALAAGFACLAFVTVLSAEEAKVYRGVDVTPQVKIEHSPLQKLRGSEYRLNLTIKNQSAEKLTGPLGLVIEKTGEVFLLPKKYDGRFVKGGDGFLVILSGNQSLNSGQSRTIRGVTLETLVEPKANPEETFELTAKIFELRSKPQEQVATNNRQKNNSNLVSPLLRPSGSVRTNGTSGSSSTVKPIPDPGPQPTPAVAGTEPADQKFGGFHAPRPRVPTNEEVAKAAEVKDAWAERVFDIEGVHAVGTGWLPDGSAGVSVFVQNFGDKKNIPDQLDGVAVHVTVQDQVELLQTRAGRVGFPVHPLAGNCFDDPTRVFERPIPIGVSGWNQAIDICATGTLGSRLEDTTDVTQKFILSNSHVLADNGLALSTLRPAQVGDPVIQPGPLDSNCAFASDGVVGTLADWTTVVITNNNDINLIDAAIASTSPLFTSTATPCNGYGVPSEVTVTAYLDQEVMKYGRTTLFTTGVVFLLDLDVDVAIDEDPLDPTNVTTARYSDQIAVISDSSFFGSFSAGGDSGSLVVTRDGRNPVGLLFAGNSFITLINPIDTVLSTIGSGTLRVDGEPGPVVVP